MAVTQPPQPVTAAAETRPAETRPADAGGRREPDAPTRLAGRTDLGTITIADRVVTKIAAQAAADNPDAGAAAGRVLGRAMPAAVPGARSTDLGALPKTTVQVDGSKAFVSLEIAVRWPAPIPDVAERVREHVRKQVRDLAGLEAVEVHIVVASLASTITPPPRVR